MPDKIATLYRIGTVVSVEGDLSTIRIEPDYVDGLYHIDTADHLDILFWIPLDRDVLKVHPHGDPERKLRGVFSTRSPVRPNPIGLTRVKLVSHEGATIVVRGLDALIDTAVVDIKIGEGPTHGH